MTRQRDFKSLVRERMKKTGERYSAARAHLLHTPGNAAPAPAFPGVLDGYDRFGGIQSGTGAVFNVLRHAGIASPTLSEAAVDGLCGGPGFLYAVFEYKGWPPMLTLALRSRSMPDTYIAEGLSRLGVRVTTKETTSKPAARKALDACLDAGTAAICVVDAASLPWCGLPRAFIGGGPHVVAVIGRDGGDYWIDDRASTPFRIGAEQLAAARAAYRKAKNRLVSIDGPDPRYDTRKAVRLAVADTARSYVEPAVPKSFWVNCGFSGLEKWQQLLTDPKDKKGWPTLFADRARACSGLQRAYECIDTQSPPGAGRGLYAQFLDESAQALGQPALAAAAAAFRDAGQRWSTIANLIATCPDAAVRRACELSERRLELGDEAADDVKKESAELWGTRAKLAEECRLTKVAAQELFAEMADLVGTIAEAERAGVGQLRRGCKG